jgi:YesN/AraC family two-component response regulator
VDDDPKILKALKSYLEKIPNVRSLLTSSDGIDASYKLNNQTFDLIVIDLQMPKMDGIKLMKLLIRNNLVEPETVLMISGFFEASVIQEASSLGLKNFIVKPFDRETITDKAKRILVRNLTT